MKALFVTNRYPPDGFGGYERVAASAVAWLRGRGHELRVLTTRGSPSGDGVHRELGWWLRDGEWARPGRLERRRVVRRDLDAVRRHAEGRDVVAWWAMGGLPLAMMSGLEGRSVGVVHDGWLVYGREVDCGPPGFTPAVVDCWLVNSRAVLRRGQQGGRGLGTAGLSCGGRSRSGRTSTPRCCRRGSTRASSPTPTPGRGAGAWPTRGGSRPRRA